MVDESKARKAANAIRQAVMMMQRSAPGLLHVYMGITGIPTDNPEVMVRAGVNGGTPILEYNVDFVTYLEESLLGAIVYMECERIALHHCDRRKQEPLEMLKLASDVVVAEYARKLVDTSVGKNLEIVNQLFPSFWNYWPVLQKHGFHPETDLTLEKLFEIFKEEYATMKPQEEDEEDRKEDKKETQGDSKEDDRKTEAKGNEKAGDRKKEGSKDGSEEADTSGSPGEGGPQGDGKEDGSSGEDGKDKGEEESGEKGDGGQGESGEGDNEPGEGDKDSESGSDGEQSGDSPEGDSSDGENSEGDSPEGESDGQPDEREDDSGTHGQGGGGDGSSGEGSDGGSEPSGNPGDGASGDDGEGDDGDGEGEGGTESDSGSQSDEVSGGSGRGEPPKDDFESMSRYFSLTNAGKDLEKWGQDEVARDSVTAKVNEALDKGMFDRVRGPLPIMLRNANRVRVDKEAMFRRFMTSLQDDEREDTWSRRNRKYLRYGMIAPGYVYKETQRILFCIDVSGSMYQGDAIANCLTVMENVVNGLSIDIVYWDAVCSPVFTAPKSITDMAIYGGGRTDPDCVLRKLGPERYKYDGLIFLTDCIFNWSMPAKHKQIMILRTHGKHEFPAWCVYKDELETFIGA